MESRKQKGSYGSERFTRTRYGLRTELDIHGERGATLLPTKKVLAKGPSTMIL